MRRFGRSGGWCVVLSVPMQVAELLLVFVDCFGDLMSRAARDFVATLSSKEHLDSRHKPQGH